MRRKLVFFIILLVLIGVLIFGIRYIVLRRSNRQGVLKVSSNTAARVLLENRDIGKTPLEQKVNVGEYSIRLVPETSTVPLTSWQGRVTIGGNTLTYVNRDLSESELTSAGEQLWLEKTTSNKAELSIISVPDGANVIIDDQARGVTPLALTDISEGDHAVVINSPGFEPRTVKVKLTPGYKAIVSASLALSPSQIASPTLFEIQDSTPSSTLQPTPSQSIAQVTPTVKPTVKPTIKPTLSSTVETPSRVRITDTPVGFLRVRKEPTTASSEIGRATPGQEYDVLTSQGTWYQITFEQQQGWISSQYAEEIE